MLAEFKKTLRNDPWLRFILLGGLLLQLIFCITSVGFHHPDQHFQIIEFSSYQLGEPTGATKVWEFYNPIRPTIQVYLFSGIHVLLNAIGVKDPFTILTITRIFTGMLLFFVFNWITLFYFRNSKKVILYLVLLLLNFSWFFPYVRSLFNSEMLSAVFFYGTAVWYDSKKDEKPGWLFLAAIGFLFSLSFYFRFQTGFFLVGFAVWFLWTTRYYSHILPISIGFIAGVAFNTWLDCEYYHKLVITPYTYYYSNIVDKRAASFGTSSVLLYLGFLISVTPVPPLSFVLAWYSIKSFLKNYKHQIFLTTGAFFLAHSVVGHKEDRFIFCIVNIMPIVIGWGLPALITFYNRCKNGTRNFIKGVVLFSVVLNWILLILFALNPWSQTNVFLYALHQRFDKGDQSTTIYCFQRTPFETPNKSPAVYYAKAFTKTKFERIENIDTARFLPAANSYIVATFDKIKDKRNFMDSLGYKPVMYSSSWLWKINEFIASKKVKNSIEDIWVLYRRK